MTSVHDFTVKKPDGTEQKLSDFAGKPMLIVNTASKCGFTPQYEGLEALHREFGDKVEIMETRRLSKTKTWRLLKIVAKAPEQAPPPEAVAPVVNP